MSKIGELYSANLIIGKTLIAKKTLNAFSLPLDNDPNKKLLFTIKPNNTVGVVDTYFKPAPNRNSLWWGFVSNIGGKKTYYYVEHAKDNFSLDALKSQNVPTVDQEIEKDTTWDEKLSKLLKTTFNYALIIGGVFILYKLIDNKKND
jgi:hypothetical protein